MQQLLIIVHDIPKIAPFKKTKGKGLEITRGEGLVIISWRGKLAVFFASLRVFTTESRYFVLRS